MDPLKFQGFVLKAFDYTKDLPIDVLDNSEE